MKRLCLIILFISIVLVLHGQNLIVQDFHVDKHDMTAKDKDNAVLDQNGKKCALIKIKTDIKGLSFDVGSLGVVKTMPNDNGVWVYVPEGVKRITLSHQEYGVLRDYDLGQTLKRGVTYLMSLIGENNRFHTTTAKAQTQQLQYVMFRLFPANSVVVLDNDTLLAENGLAWKRMELGTYKYQVKATGYQTKEGSVSIRDMNKKEEVNVSLNKTKKIVTFKVTPKNAIVELANETLMTRNGIARKELEYGTYNYLVQAEGFYSERGTVVVDDSEKAPGFQITLDKKAQPVTKNAISYGSSVAYKNAFSSVRVKLITDKNAEIWVNNQRKGVGSWTGKLPVGINRFETKRPNHIDGSFVKDLIYNDKTEQIRLPSPVPYGQIDISSTPDSVEIYIDNKSYGLTPQQIPKISVGKHLLRMTHPEYSDYIDTVSVQKNKTNKLLAKMSKETNILIKSNNPNAKFFIDGVEQGIASGWKETTLGKHLVRMVDDGWKDFTDSIHVKKDRKYFIFKMTEPQKIFNVGDVKFKMIFVEGGSFEMGETKEQGTLSHYERPVHKVNLSSYYLGETEVTQELWKAVMGTNPSKFVGDLRPVENVSWNDCIAFVNKLNNITGQYFRLPTEAEWEYAARGGNCSKNSRFSGSNDINEVGWYSGNSKGQTHVIKMLKANELGLYDMTGNVMEWCQDYNGYYSSSEQTNPKGPSDAYNKICRGGCWKFGARANSLAYRHRDYPEYKIKTNGLRLALDLK